MSDLSTSKHKTHGPMKFHGPVRTVFTSGMVATICGVSMGTVTRIYCTLPDESKRLRFTRVPNSKYRRFRRDDFIDFLKANKLQPILEKELLWEWFLEQAHLERVQQRAARKRAKGRTPNQPPALKSAPVPRRPCRPGPSHSGGRSPPKPQRAGPGYRRIRRRSGQTNYRFARAREI